MQRETGDLKKQKHRDVLICFLFFTFFAYILHGLPLVVDDYGFLYKRFSSNTEALKAILAFGNGRLLGNGGSVFLMHHVLLGDLIRAAALTALVFLLPTVLQLRGKRTYWISMLLLLTMSPRMFAQSISWRSGFQNYVPPVLLFIMAMIVLQSEVSERKWIRILRSFGLFLLGIMMQLYIEHSAFLNVFCIAALLFFGKLKCTPVKGAVILLTGTVLGLGILLLTPSWFAPEGYYGHDSYFSGGVLNLLRNVVRNTVYLTGQYSENAIALLMLAGLQSIIVLKHRERFSPRACKALLIGMLVPAGAFLVLMVTGIRLGYGKLCIAESGCILPLFLIYWTSYLYSLVYLAWKLRERKLKQAMILASFSLIAVFPLLFLWPVGYRGLFHSYVFLTGVILVQTEYILTECIKIESRMI